MAAIAMFDQNRADPGLEELNLPGFIRTDRAGNAVGENNERND